MIFPSAFLELLLFSRETLCVELSIQGLHGLEDRVKDVGDSIATSDANEKQHEKTNAVDGTCRTHRYLHSPKDNLGLAF